MGLVLREAGCELLVRSELLVAVPAQALEPMSTGADAAEATNTF